MSKKDRNEYRRKYRQENIEHLKEVWRDYYHKNHYKIRLKQKLRRYNITEDDYNGLLCKQENRCPGCHVDLGTLPSKLVHIDHCHTTNIVRGIACTNCNTALGQVKENICTLRNLINYLEKHNDVATTNRK